MFDLGVNNGVDKYLEAIEKHQPEIVGMSALLTTTMPYMKVIIDTLKEKGIRNDHIVLVGGAPLNKSFAEAIGADAYCRDAAVTVETARALLARRQGTGASARERLNAEVPPVTLAPAAELFAEASYPRRRRRRAQNFGHCLRRGWRAKCCALKLDAIDLACLPAQLHNHPKRIPGAMRAKIRANREAYDEILCLYGDCGTGGELDRVLAEERVSRIEGAHCYEFYAGGEAFSALGRRRAGHVLPHRFPRPPFRRARHSRPRPRPLS